jgi:hypothetical protein
MTVGTLILVRVRTLTFPKSAGMAPTSLVASRDERLTIRPTTNFRDGVSRLAKAGP